VMHLKGLVFLRYKTLINLSSELLRARRGREGCQNGTGANRLDKLREEGRLGGRIVKPQGDHPLLIRLSYLF
jgi:hypothetical protein